MHTARNFASWIVDVLPEISNFILILVGIVISMPKLAESIENNKKKFRIMAACCFVLGVAGLIESVNQRRQANTSIDSLIKNTNAAVTNTNTLVTTFGILMPQVNSLNAQVADLDKKIEAAKGNSKLTAELRAQVEAARAQSNTVSTQILLAMAPGISNQLKDVGERWYVEDDKLLGRPRFTEADRLELQQNRSDMAGRYLREVKRLMVTADYLRQQLLQQLPSSDQTLEDKTYAINFARFVVGDSFRPGDSTRPEDIRNAANYLFSLYKRIASKVGAPIELKTVM